MYRCDLGAVFLSQGGGILGNREYPRCAAPLRRSRNFARSGAPQVVAQVSLRAHGPPHAWCEPPPSHHGSGRMVPLMARASPVRHLRQAPVLLIVQERATHGRGDVRLVRGSFPGNAAPWRQPVRPRVVPAVKARRMRHTPRQHKVVIRYLTPQCGLRALRAVSTTPLHRLDAPHRPSPFKRAHSWQAHYRSCWRLWCGPCCRCPWPLNGPTPEWPPCVHCMCRNDTHLRALETEHRGARFHDEAKAHRYNEHFPLTFLRHAPPVCVLSSSCDAPQAPCVRGHVREHVPVVVGLGGCSRLG